MWVDFIHPDCHPCPQPSVIILDLRLKPVPSLVVWVGVGPFAIVTMDEVSCEWPEEGHSCSGSWAEGVDMRKVSVGAAGCVGCDVGGS